MSKKIFVECAKSESGPWKKIGTFENAAIANLLAKAHAKHEKFTRVRFQGAAKATVYKGRQ